MHDVKEVGTATPTYANLLTLVRVLLALLQVMLTVNGASQWSERLTQRDARSTIGTLICLKLNVDDEYYEFQP